MSLNITGNTRVMALIGWPVRHSLSPIMQNAAAHHAGIDLVYVCLPVIPAELHEAVNGLRALGFAGANVTIPHKEKVLPYVNTMSDEARLVGAANTIVNDNGQLMAHNTDVYGFLRALEKNGVSVEGRCVLIFGAGGVARAISIACATRGASAITLTDIVAEKAAELAGAVKKASTGAMVHVAAPDSAEFYTRLAGAELICNATPIGMKSTDPCLLGPLQLDQVSSDAVVFDAVYSIRGTKLQHALRNRGHIYIGGLDMLLYQGVRAFELVTGVHPDEEVMRTALNESGTQS